MLEGVIEHQQFGPPQIDGLSGGCNPIRILHVRHIRQAPSQLPPSSFGPVRAPLYPRLISATRAPRWANHWASQATRGVLPVPPVVTFPTLTTGTSTRRTASRPESYPQLPQLHRPGIGNLGQPQATSHRAGPPASTTATDEFLEDRGRQLGNHASANHSAPRD